VIALDLRAGEGLPEHEVHERAWIVVIAGEVEISSATGERVSGTSGLLPSRPDGKAGRRLGVRRRNGPRVLLDEALDRGVRAQALRDGDRDDERQETDRRQHSKFNHLL
jgi:hypothetical protein